MSADGQKINFTENTMNDTGMRQSRSIDCPAQEEWREADPS